MRKRFPITVDEKDLEVAYQQMAWEEAREVEALEWAEAAVGDMADEARWRLVGPL
jgi:hypothetical protein